MFFTKCALLLLCIGISKVSSHERGCTLKLTDSRAVPIVLLKRTNSPSFTELPKTDLVDLAYKETVFLGCLGTKNYIKETEKFSSGIATCEGNDILQISNIKDTFDNIACTRPLTGDVESTQTSCANGHGKIHKLGYRISKDIWIDLIDICQDDIKGITHYTQHNLYCLTCPGKGLNRRNFQISGTFYKRYTSKVANLYSRSTENELKKKFPSLKEKYLSAGHLTPAGDFSITNYKRATYSYINTCPQWDITNEGNWKKMEEEVRTVSRESQRPYQIITGTHGVLSFKNDKDALTPLYMLDNDKIPVPQIMWKIMYDEEFQNGIAFVSINDPYTLKVPETSLICNDICDQYGWGNKESWRNINEGFQYCCELGAFLDQMQTAPKLKVKGTLYGPNSSSGKSSKSSSPESKRIPSKSPNRLKSNSHDTSKSL